MWELDIAIASFLRGVLERLGVRRVVDLCSGSGGPWKRIMEAFEESGFSVDVCLTDKYPNEPAFEYLRASSRGRLGFSLESVEASHVPESLSGFRTIFSGFHHFRPIEAVAVLRDAVHCREGIVVFEFTERKPLPMLVVMAASVFMPLFVPFLRPFRWPRLLWTYLIPLAPAVTLCDSFVSCLRTYSAQELRELTEGEALKGYTWETGKIKVPHCPISVTYLLGHPSS